MSKFFKRKAMANLFLIKVFFTRRSYKGVTLFLTFEHLGHKKGEFAQGVDGNLDGATALYFGRFSARVPGSWLFGLIF